MIWAGLGVKCAEITGYCAETAVDTVVSEGWICWSQSRENHFGSFPSGVAAGIGTNICTGGNQLGGATADGGIFRVSAAAPGKHILGAGKAYIIEGGSIDARPHCRYKETRIAIKLLNLLA